MHLFVYSFYLSDGHPADGGIQDAGVGVGAHFGHKTEPLPPANAVLLNLLSAEGERNSGASISHIKHIHVLPVNYLNEGLPKHFQLALNFFFFFFLEGARTLI